MRRALTTLVALGLLAAACTTAEGGLRSSGPSGIGGAPTGGELATGSAASTGAEPVGVGLPDPDERIPRDPRRLAAALTATWTERQAAVDAWVASGGTTMWPPPEELELLVLFEQRIYRALAGDPHLAARVLGRLTRYELDRAARNPFGLLSGGQQARFQILLMEIESPTMLLLDEPTDNLDVASADALEEAIRRYEGTVIAVTHDRWFMRMMDRFLFFEQDGSVRELLESPYEDAATLA